MFSDPVIGALGNKAQGRLRKYVPDVGQEDFVESYSVAPLGCNFEGAEESWREMARQIHEANES